jgi:hypothetical protein
MKTEKSAIQQLIDFLEPELKMHDFLQLPAHEKAKELLETEKQQHEQTAIHITNVLMDALDNPKGGKFSVEDEFNKYWDNTYTANKEALK